MKRAKCWSSRYRLSHYAAPSYAMTLDQNRCGHSQPFRRETLHILRTTTMALQAERPFGPHLMLDMRGCDPDKLWDYRLVFDVLHQLPNEIGMTRITQPYVFPYSGVEPADAGITGVAIIAESHISIHTFPLKRFAFTDVFSCKPFDCKRAREYLVKKFRAEHHEHWLIDRGGRFPRGADSARDPLKCDKCGQLFDGTDDVRCRSPHTGVVCWICPRCGTPA